ncbi:MAG: LysR family transcriptional regulator [Oscillospiraceae bacterium]
MQIKLELYRIFKEVATHNSISDAAKSLFISQSAVSQAIRQLETQLNLTLFRRTPKGVVLTTEGQLLFEYAVSAIDLLEVAEKKLHAMKDLSYGDLKIGASDTISRYLLLSRLERFNKLYPKIKLQIVNRTSIEAIALLKTGKIDLAFVNMPISDNEIVVDEYMPVHDIFVGGKEYAGKKYSLTEIANLPLILLEKKSNSRRYVENFFNQNGIQISPEIELGSHDLLLEFAKIKLGVSCVIQEFSEQYLKSGELVELFCQTPIPARQIGIASLKGVSLSAAAKKFVEE